MKSYLVIMAPIHIKVEQTWNYVKPLAPIWFYLPLCGPIYHVRPICSLIYFIFIIFNLSLPLFRINYTYLVIFSILWPYSPYMGIFFIETNSEQKFREIGQLLMDVTNYCHHIIKCRYFPECVWCNCIEYWHIELHVTATSHVTATVAIFISLEFCNAALWTVTRLGVYKTMYRMCHYVVVLSYHCIPLRYNHVVTIALSGVFAIVSK